MRLLPLCLVLLLFLAACGGQPAGADPDPTPDPIIEPDPDPEPQPDAGRIVIASHVDGERIVGDRSITFAGSVEGLTEPVSVTLTQNGAPVEVAFDGEAFAAELELQLNANRLVVTATGEGASTATAELTLEYPFADLETFQSGSLVIGQPDLESGDSGLGPGSLFGAEGATSIHQGRLYVPDFHNNRVLVFEGLPSANGAEAIFAMGQPDLYSDSRGTSATTLARPSGMASHGERLLVLEDSNSRVLIWNEPPTGPDSPADVVVGQPGFDARAWECDAAHLYLPKSLSVAGGRLVVADTSNHRVLIWNEVPRENGVLPDLVLGQATFDTCEPNDDDQNGSMDGGPTARTLDNPTGVWTDGVKLAVADRANNRVLIWSEFPTESFTPADIVLGQPDMTSRWAGVGPDRMQNPVGVTSNGNQLFVSDLDNYRVLVWNGFPDAARDADVVLGQASLEAREYVGDADPQRLTTPFGLYFHDGKLLVSDRRNNRIVVFE